MMIKALMYERFGFKVTGLWIVIISGRLKPINVSIL